MSATALEDRQKSRGPVEPSVTGQLGRLHDRFRYARGGDGWAIERLAP